MTPPTAEGGALRAQSFRRPAGESRGPQRRGPPPRSGDRPRGGRTTRRWQRRPDPRGGSSRTGFGTRSGSTFRPGTSDLYIGDVGYTTWEEVDRLANPLDRTDELRLAVPRRARESRTYYTSVSLNLCTTLSDASATNPLYDYAQTGHMAVERRLSPGLAGDAASASTAVSRSTRAPTTRPRIKAPVRRRLCPQLHRRPARRRRRRSGRDRDPVRSAAAAPVMLTTDPHGDLVYVGFAERQDPSDPLSARRSPLHRDPVERAGTAHGRVRRRRIDRPGRDRELRLGLRRRIAARPPVRHDESHLRRRHVHGASDRHRRRTG